jgi:hypothetical protein
MTHKEVQYDYRLIYRPLTDMKHSVAAYGYREECHQCIYVRVCKLCAFEYVIQLLPTW